MRRIAAACIVAICSASTGSAADLVTKAPSQELISQSSTSLQLYLMPDLQYIVRPSAASTYPNAWVVDFRLSALF